MKIPILPCKTPPSPSHGPSPFIQASVFPGKGVRKLLKNILLLYWDWHLTELRGVLTWVNLNDKLGFISQGSSFTIEQHDCFTVEGERGRIKVFFKSPVVPLTCQKAVTHSLLIHANQMSPLCNWLDYSLTPLNSGSGFRVTLLSERFSSPLIFSFFKTWQLTSFKSCPCSVREDCLMVSWLASRQKQHVFHRLMLLPKLGPVALSTSPHRQVNIHIPVVLLLC